MHVWLKSKIADVEGGRHKNMLIHFQDAGGREGRNNRAEIEVEDATLPHLVPGNVGPVRPLRSLYHGPSSLFFLFFLFSHSVRQFVFSLFLPFPSTPRRTRHRLLVSTPFHSVLFPNSVSFSFSYIFFYCTPPHLHICLLLLQRIKKIPNNVGNLLILF